MKRTDTKQTRSSVVQLTLNISIKPKGFIEILKIVLRLTTDDHTLMIGKQVKQERAQGGCLGTESLRKT